VSRRLDRGSSRTRRRNRVALWCSTAAGFATTVAIHFGMSPGSLAALPSTGGSTPTTTAPSTTVPATGGVRRATGSVEQYGYGQLAVAVTASGSTITDVSVPTLSTIESYSQQLAQQVIPTLRNEVLNAQSANVAAVSGATYTSQAYLSSLQSALDTLHV